MQCELIIRTWSKMVKLGHKKGDGALNFAIKMPLIDAFNL